jgi:hypothetical protein
VLASLQRPLTLTLARSSAAGALSTVSQEDTSKAAKHSRKAMGNTLAAARAAWEDRVDASQAHHHHHHHSSLGGGGRNNNGTGGGLDHDHHPHATSASTPRPTKPDGPALAWTTAMAFRARWVASWLCVLPVICFQVQESAFSFRRTCMDRCSRSVR